MSLEEATHKSADTCTEAGEEEEVSRRGGPGDLMLLKEEGEWASGASCKLDCRRARGRQWGGWREEGPRRAREGMGGRRKQTNERTGVICFLGSEWNDAQLGDSTTQTTTSSTLFPVSAASGNLSHAALSASQSQLATVVSASRKSISPH
ncbi:hypothetical protein BDY19DRAFT_902320 [Irpex rosettiformis]|uniref:Uncharacterized protein n=1 Tax=Irpex rosettiformis TaxID=378272 RepID=A0ACB8UH77_9APHY|nr:hypothetical protein BDY19DRAFT_902320 [Irpex rosettiformis]